MEMWLGLLRRRRQFVAGDAMALARLLYYAPTSEEEAVYYLQKHTGATIETIHDAYGDHLLVNGRKLTFGITIPDLEEDTDEALG